MTKASQLSPTPVRIPDELKARLKESALGNERSLNGEILSRLRSTFSQTLGGRAGTLNATPLESSEIEGSMFTTATTKEQQQ